MSCPFFLKLIFSTFFKENFTLFHLTVEISGQPNHLKVNKYANVVKTYQTYTVLKFHLALLDNAEKWTWNFFCFEYNICHRDLKLENVLLDDNGNAKIADFGLANTFSLSSLLSTFCGSPLYASPEIVKGTPYVGPEIDCWSLGVLLYTLVYGAMPFDGSNFKKLVKQISLADYFEPKNPSPASPLIADMLNVDPKSRADIRSICSHWWINETYTEECLNVADELARQTPVHLDLIISSETPAMYCQEIVAEDKRGDFDDGVKPARSQCLGDLTPPASFFNIVSHLPEAKKIATDDKKAKTKKREYSHSIRKTRQMRSRSSVGSQEIGVENTESCKAEAELESENVVASALPLRTSETMVIAKSSTKPVKQTGLISSSLSTSAKIESECTKNAAPKHKSIERRKYKMFDVVEKSDAFTEKSPSLSSEKGLLSVVNVNEACNESLISVSTPLSNESHISNSNAPSEETFPLISTVALNEIVESAFHNEPVYDAKIPSVSINEVDDRKMGIVTELLSTNAAEINIKKAATLPRRRTRAEINLDTSQLGTSVDNQFEGSVIPIQVNQESRCGITSQLPWSASKLHIARSSSASLSCQSTVESDCGSTVSFGEPIQKSPREIIIPAVIKESCFLPPRNNSVFQISSLKKVEKVNSNDARNFTLFDARRKQPEQISSALLDTIDSLSSDEDDSFQLLTAENLFSTLLSRVRSLTQRINNEEMKSSTLVKKHGLFFDTLLK